jgi:xanthine dehydrogenase YagR molybdenum-binding subunit
MIGKPLDRVDGRVKVTGGAKYAAEHNLENVAYGVVVMSTVAAGRIKSIDDSAAKKSAGVIAVMSYVNAPKLNVPTPEAQRENRNQALSLGEPRHVPFRDPVIHYLGQHVAVVIADTLEQATRGAELVKVTYDATLPRTELQKYRGEMRETGQNPTFKKGDADAALATAPVKVDQIYRTPYEHHNPLEAHSVIAAWTGDRLTLYDSSQNIFAVRNTLSVMFEVPRENVRVLSPFVGGAFGSKGSSWPHVIIGVMAARQVKRPVKLVLTRKQLYFASGHRPETEQRVAIGANRDGKIVSLIHEGFAQGSMVSDYNERVTRPTRAIYNVPNMRGHHKVVAMNVSSPTFTRAPGESPGMFAIESAMDELAYALGMDPVQLRVVNHADAEPLEGKPWSSKSLKECYSRGAERFGWSRRNAQPRSMRDGRNLIGWGMASALYPAHRTPANARVIVRSDGTVLVSSGSHEMGMGTATVMAQLAADTLGLPVERVRFELGDTTLPQAPISAGSMTAASVGSAVYGACRAVMEKVAALSAAGTAAAPLDYSAILLRHYMNEVEARFEARPEQVEAHAAQSFGAHFAEVSVDPDLGLVRVQRIVSAFASGRILNAKTARSQYLGGIIWGVGQALLEETHFDERIGSYTNVNLAEYLVPVNADIRSIDIILVEEDDPHVNPIGVKGVGEVGIVGVAPAIANAVYHATGKRVRDLPITIEKVM